MNHPFEFRADTNDSSIFTSVALLNEYRLPESFTADDIIIDIGGHIGSFSYAALQRGAGHVYVFEAAPFNYERIVYNLRDFADRVTVKNQAVWRSDVQVEHLMFEVDDSNTGGGSVIRTDLPRFQVDVISFDDVIRTVTNNGARRVRMLKIDCEGAEFPILITSRMLSLIDTIHGEFHEIGREPRPFTVPDFAIVPGYHRYTIDELSDTLEAAGFQVVFHRFPDSYMGLFFARHRLATAIPEDGYCTPFQVKQPLKRAELWQRLASVPQWQQRVEVSSEVETACDEPTAEHLAWLDLPADLQGKRVLVLGASDGLFAFTCERRGAAEVVALDVAQTAGFALLHELFESQVRFQQGSVYDLSVDNDGTFDVVLCLGVLEQLRHPLLALERIHEVCRGTLIVETAVSDPLFADATGALDLAATPLALLNAQQHTVLLNGVTIDALLRSAGFVPRTIQMQQGRIRIDCLSVVGQEPTSSSAQERTVGETIAPARHIYDQEIVQACEQQAAAVAHLRHLLGQRELHLHDLEKRVQWLEELAKTTRSALERLEHGRAMRLLRWLMGRV